MSSVLRPWKTSLVPSMNWTMSAGVFRSQFSRWLLAMSMASQPECPSWCWSQLGVLGWQPCGLLFCEPTYCTWSAYPASAIMSQTKARQHAISVMLSPRGTFCLCKLEADDVRGLEAKLTDSQLLSLPFGELHRASRGHASQGEGRDDVQYTHVVCCFYLAALHEWSCREHCRKATMAQGVERPGIGSYPRTVPAPADPNRQCRHSVETQDAIKAV